MLLFPPPPLCNLVPGTGSDNPSVISLRRFSFPILRSTSSPKSRTPLLLPPPPPPPMQQSNAATAPTHDMSSLPGTPRSSFSPTLGSIPELLEHKSLETSTSPPATPIENQDVIEAFIPEASCVSPASLTRANSHDAIIESPRKAQSFTTVCKVLRGVLEADRVRRRRILGIYLKAIVFLKYLWRANERYGNVMVTTGMYMQR